MDHFTNAVYDIVRSTRVMLMSEYGKSEVIAQKGDDAWNIVTKMDREVEDFLKAKLHALDPSIGFVGEECGGDRSVERYWLCDPIDGTGYYKRGTPLCTSMLGLMDRGRPTHSFIDDFVRGDMYHAVRGVGAFKNGIERIKVSDRSLAEAYIFIESDIGKGGNLALLAELNRRRICYEVLWSSGYDHIEVACGRREARITKDAYGKDYDYIPGILLVEEAGGIRRNVGMQTYDYIIGNPRVIKELTEGPDAIFPIR